MTETAATSTAAALVAADADLDGGMQALQGPRLAVLEERKGAGEIRRSPPKLVAPCELTAWLTLTRHHKFLPVRTLKCLITEVMTQTTRQMCWQHCC